MESAFVFVLILSVIGYIGALFFASSIAKSTGYNLYSGFIRKCLMIAGGLGLAGFMSLSEDPDVKAYFLLSFVMTFGALALLFLMNKKATVSPVQSVILSVLEILSGFVMLLVFVLSIIFKMMGSSFSNTIDFDNTIAENARKHNEALKEQRNEEAEAAARAMGFDSANEAAAYHMGPGRED